jgi:hypothetical protein
MFLALPPRHFWILPYHLDLPRQYHIDFYGDGTILWIQYLSSKTLNKSSSLRLDIFTAWTTKSGITGSTIYTVKMLLLIEAKEDRPDVVLGMATCFCTTAQWMVDQDLAVDTSSGPVTARKWTRGLSRDDINNFMTWFLIVSHGVNIIPQKAKGLNKVYFTFPTRLWWFSCQIPGRALI